MGSGRPSQLEITALEAAGWSVEKTSSKFFSLTRQIVEKIWPTSKTVKRFHGDFVGGLGDDYLMSVVVESYRKYLDQGYHYTPTPDFGKSLESLQPHYSRRSLGSIAFVSDDPARFISERENRILLENERLKTQLISQQRAVLTALQERDRLSAQNAELVEGVCELAKANRALQDVVVAQKSGRLCFHEEYSGVVSEIQGDQIEVIYETPEGPLKQVYHRSQFMHGKMPQEGDTVEAHAMIVAAKNQEGGTESKQTSDLPKFRDRGVSGTIHI